MSQPQGHFTTGEFARLCGVSKHTLCLYDELGVFSPIGRPWTPIGTPSSSAGRRRPSSS